MDKKLNLVPKLSLSEMALRRVAVHLWSDSFIFASMQRIRKFNLSASTDFRCVWQRIMDKVKDKVLKLMLPKSLKERMMLLVRPIGKEILRWKWFHEHILNDVSNEELDMCILEQLCWTVIGAVDYQKTAKELLRPETCCLDVVKRYRLACLYCLEDCIPVLWEELPETYKSRFNEEVYPLPENVVHLEYYWAFVLKREEFKLNYILPREFSSIPQFFFKYSACKFSKAATEYFFQKLTVEERVNALFITLCGALGSDTRSNLLGNGHEKPISDVVCYLFSLMTHEQQMQVFKERPFRSLMFFLDWPWQDLCLDIAEQIWNFLPESRYGLVLDGVCSNFFNSGCYFPDLFQKFFKCSPNNFRKYFVHRECRYGNIPFFSKFIRDEDAETIKIVLRNLDSGDRMRLLYNRPFFILLCCLMLKDKWDFIDLCLGEATLPKDDRQMLKEAYMGFPKMDCEESKWKRLFELLDGSSASSNSTKCLEDETLTRPERLSSEEENSDLTKKLKRR